MAATYKQFLASPNSSQLAEKASLHYVTTLTSFSGATEIIKHLNTLQKQVKKKKEDVINLVDGQNIVAIEIDTALEFLTSGGAYLPGLDDNFLSDRVAYLPIMHIVTFDADGKILQIRQQWDQASLLKQMDVIGKSGRNWPIKDGREQLALIQNCLKLSGSTAGTTQSQTGAAATTATTTKPRTNSTNIMRDPHASLHLFGTREDIESAEPVAVLSPYAGQKPKQRSFTDILGDDPQHGDTGSYNRSMSPSKAGHGKNHHPIRIFDGQEHKEDDDSPQAKPSQYIRAHPAKYQHFDFADGSKEGDIPESNAGPAPRTKSKHDSQWSFEDFVTPVKAKPTRAAGNNPSGRNWDTDASQAEPAKAPAGKPRRDAETHFELQDDGELPPDQRRIATHTRGVAHNEGLGLYKDNVFDRQEEGADPSNRALGNITNIKDRGKDFDSHFTISDDSPSAAAPAAQPVAENRKKAVNMMNANWTLSDESPVSQKENRVQASKGQPDTRIHISGDGMGGKKGTQRDFLYGDDVVDQPKPLISRKANHGTQKSGFWDY